MKARHVSLIPVELSTSSASSATVVEKPSEIASHSFVGIASMKKSHHYFADPQGASSSSSSEPTPAMTSTSSTRPQQISFTSRVPAILSRKKISGSLMSSSNGNIFARNKKEPAAYVLDEGAVADPSLKRPFAASPVSIGIAGALADLAGLRSAGGVCEEKENVSSNCGGASSSSAFPPTVPESSESKQGGIADSNRIKKSKRELSSSFSGDDGK